MTLTLVIATILLVVATLLLAEFTAKMASATRDAANATQAAVTQTAQQVELAEKALAAAEEANRQARDRWVADLDLRRSAQASRVACTDIGDAADRQLLIVNRSDIDIFDVRAFNIDAGHLKQETHVIPGPRLGPGDHHSTNLSSVHGVASYERGAQCGFTFRDAAGFHWARFLNGELRTLDGVEYSVALARLADWPGRKP